MLSALWLCCRMRYCGTIMKVASYNIRKCVGLDWQRRPDRIAAVLGEIGAAVVLVQEADKRMGERSGTLSDNELRRACGLRLVPVNGDGVSHGFHGNALLVSVDVAVERLEPLELPSLEPRGAILAEVSDTDGRRLRLIGTHMGLRGADRRRQVETIVAALERCETAMPAVVLGDFNEWFSPGDSLSSLYARFSSTELGVTFHTSAPVASLDRIFVSSEIAVSAAGVHRSPTAQRASDHLPVWADLELEGVP
ncbi:MAG: endonuclease/exonuclease/phosphatase family protein [Alphaproteobacteria bacterium]|nr:endonuclease/exonuclease/phosphatase family protein [Alphaproteobacteria bacterium]